MTAFSRKTGLTNANYRKMFGVFGVPTEHVSLARTALGTHSQNNILKTNLFKKGIEVITEKEYEEMDSIMDRMGVKKIGSRAGPKELREYLDIGIKD